MKNKESAIYLVAVFREAMPLWGRNLVPLVVINSVYVLCAKGFRLFVPFAELCREAGPSFFISSLFIVMLAAVVFLGLFIGLIILCYLREVSVGKKIAWPSVFKDALASYFSYIKTFFLQCGFILGLGATGLLFWTGGNFFYSGHAPWALRIIMLVSTSTIFVALVIAAAWYGFFFSLGPLIAAFEKKGPWASMLESRFRIKGNALRYLSTLIIYFVLFWGIGLTAVFAASFTNRAFLNAIDPIMAAFFGPLLFIIWFVNYRRLSESKG